MKRLLLFIFCIATASTAFSFQSKSVIKDSTAVVQQKHPMVLETINRFVWAQKRKEIEEQSRAYLEFEKIIEAGGVDTIIMKNLLNKWAVNIGGVECLDYVKIVDSYKYQIFFTD